MLSWAAHPMCGKLLGLLDLTVQPSTIIVDFTCLMLVMHGHGSGSEPASLMVKLWCLHVAHYIELMQVPSFPKIGEHFYLF